MLCWYGYQAIRPCTPLAPDELASVYKASGILLQQISGMNTAASQPYWACGSLVPNDVVPLW